MYTRSVVTGFLMAWMTATATSGAALPNDAGSTGGADAAGAADASGSFSADPCWDAKCPSETAACKGDADCAKASACYDAGDSPCLQALNQTAGYTKLLALQKCGWGKCTNPNGGSCAGKCGKFVKTDPCHCDDACKEFGDCCADFDGKCGLGSCATSDCSSGASGSYLDGTASSCGCGAECVAAQACCGDYETTCAGKVPVCTPACTNSNGTKKVCGPDGCGSTCGVCKAGQKCTAGACVGGGTGSDGGSTEADGGVSLDGGSGDGGEVPIDSATAGDGVVDLDLAGLDVSGGFDLAGFDLAGFDVALPDGGPNGAPDAIGGDSTVAGKAKVSGGGGSAPSSCSAARGGGGGGWVAAACLAGLAVLARRRGWAVGDRSLVRANRAGWSLVALAAVAAGCSAGAGGAGGGGSLIGSVCSPAVVSHACSANAQLECQGSGESGKWVQIGQCALPTLCQLNDDPQFPGTAKKSVSCGAVTVGVDGGGTADSVVGADGVADAMAESAGSELPAADVPLTDAAAADAEPVADAPDFDLTFDIGKDVSQPFDIAADVGKDIAKDGGFDVAKDVAKDTKPDTGPPPVTWGTCTLDDQACMQDCVQTNCVDAYAMCQNDGPCAKLTTCNSGCAKTPIVMPAQSGTPLPYNPGESQTNYCYRVCSTQAGPVAVALQEGYYACIVGFCVDCDNSGQITAAQCKSTCAQENYCLTEFTDCLGDSGCGALYGCLIQCNGDQTCLQDCQSGATSSAAAMLTAVQKCLTANAGKCVAP